MAAPYAYYVNLVNVSIESTRLVSLLLCFLHKKSVFQTLPFSRKTFTSSFYTRLSAVLYCNFTFFNENLNLILQGSFLVKLFKNLWKKRVFPIFFWRSPGLPGPKNVKLKRVSKKCTFLCSRVKSAFSERFGSAKNSVQLDMNKCPVTGGGRFFLSIY